MRFCPPFCPLPKENFIEGTLDRSTSDHVLRCEEHFTLFHRGNNHEVQIRHRRKVKK